MSDCAPRRTWHLRFHQDSQLSTIFFFPRLSFLLSISVVNVLTSPRGNLNNKPPHVVSEDTQRNAAHIFRTHLGYDGLKRYRWLLILTVNQSPLLSLSSGSSPACRWWRGTLSPGTCAVERCRMEWPVNWSVLPTAPWLPSLNSWEVWVSILWFSARVMFLFYPIIKKKIMWVSWVRQSRKRSFCSDLSWF